MQRTDMGPVGDQQLQGPSGCGFVDANGRVVVLRQEGKRVSESGGEDDAVYACDNLTHVIILRMRCCVFNQPCHWSIESSLAQIFPLERWDGMILSPGRW